MILNIKPCSRTAKQFCRNSQKDHKDPITYEVVDMTGPEHNRMFVMQVKLGDRVIGKGSGRTKQAAGQEAAYHAILALKNKQEH